MAYKGGGAQYEREEKSRHKQVQRCYGEVTRVLGNFSASGQETCHGTSSAQRLLRFVQTQPLAGASRPPLFKRWRIAPPTIFIRLARSGENQDASFSAVIFSCHKRIPTKETSKRNISAFLSYNIFHVASEPVTSLRISGPHHPPSRRGVSAPGRRRLG